MDVATTVMIEALAALEVGTRALVVDEETGALAAALKAEGREPILWQRRAIGAGAKTASAWPAEAAASAALIRLPKSKEALAFALVAAAARVPAGAPIAVFGANDEGVRSATRHLAAVAETVASVLVKRHCRVIAGTRRPDVTAAQGLADWRRVHSVRLLAGERPWVAYPGVFAEGGVDDGTRALISHLPPIKTEARVLDFAAGTGVVAAAVLEREASARVDAVEVDMVALAALAENVPAARAFAGSSLAAAPGGVRYDMIVSNPPIHDGVREDRSVLDKLVSDAPRRLAAGGALVLVVQRRVAMVPALAALFSDVKTLADDGRFTVLAARSPRA